MARWKENDCVSCPQGCIPNCSKKKDYWVYECEWCGKTTTDFYEQKRFEYFGHYHICPDCQERYENGEVDANGREIEETAYV